MPVDRGRTLQKESQPVPEQPQTEPVERNLGEQPIAGILAGHRLTNHDVVARSGGRVTHKMVIRACKGRRLTRHSQRLVQTALNAAAGTDYRVADLFLYRGLA